MLKGRPAIQTVAVVSVLLLILVVAGRDGSQVATAADVAQASTCANGIVVPDPANNPGLVSDCEALLAGRDTLAGDCNAELVSRHSHRGLGWSFCRWNPTTGH